MRQRNFAPLARFTRNRSLLRELQEPASPSGSARRICRQYIHTTDRAQATRQLFAALLYQVEIGGAGLNLRQEPVGGAQRGDRVIYALLSVLALSGVCRDIKEGEPKLELDQDGVS